MCTPRCLGLAAMVAQRSGCDLEQHEIDYRLDFIVERTDGVLQGEPHNSYSPPAAVRSDGLLASAWRHCLTLWAMSVAAGIVGDLGLFPGGAAQMPNMCQ